MVMLSVAIGFAMSLIWFCVKTLSAQNRQDRDSASRFLGEFMANRANTVPISPISPIIPTILPSENPSTTTTVVDSPECELHGSLPDSSTRTMDLE